MSLQTIGKRSQSWTTSWKGWGVVVRHRQPSNVPTREENTALARRWRDHGDETALHQLVNRNVGLAAAEAWKFDSYGVDFDDRHQAALLGLVEAARAYEPRKGAFSSYARLPIRSAIMLVISRQTRTGVSIGNDRMRRMAIFKLGAVRNRILDDGEHPTPERLAVELDISVDIAVAMDAATRPPYALDAVPVRESRDLACESVSIEQQMVDDDDSEQSCTSVRAALSTLPLLQQQIVTAVVVDGDPPRRVAVRFGLRRSEVEEIVQTALAMMRGEISRRRLQQMDDVVEIES